MNGTTTRISEVVPNRTRTDIRFAVETAYLLEVAPAVFESGVFALKGGSDAVYPSGNLRQSAERFRRQMLRPSSPIQTRRRRQEQR